MKRMLLVICVAVGITLAGACGDSGDTGGNGTGGQDATTGDSGTGGGDDTAMGGDDTAMGGDDTAMGGDDTAMGGDDTAMGGDDTAMGGDDTAMGGPDADDAGGEDPPTLFELLGGEAGITAAVTAFVGSVAADPKINGYFLNDTVDIDHVILCLTKQFATLAGSPDHTYPAEGAPADADGCRNMTDAHAGMGVSQADFNDLVDHLVAVLTGAGVSEQVIGVVGGALGGLAAIIVEDPDNNATVYQRVGRKPAIATVVDGFITRVLADVTLVGFFGTTDADRLATCLVRQVCSIDGPCLYGHGVEAELAGVPCRDMASTHAGMVDGESNPITIDDFNALVGHLGDELVANGVAESDLTALAGALAPLCPDIVGDPSTCAGDGGGDDPTWADVEPIFSAKCGGCHTGAGLGGHNIGTTGSDAGKTANNPACGGKTVGECTIIRISNGSMPQGKGCTGNPETDAGKPACLTQEELDAVQAWADAGAPE